MNAKLQFLSRDAIASGINIIRFLDIQKIFWISEKEFVISEILAH